MNRRKNYKKGPRKEIITLLYLCGIVPEKSLRYLHGANYKVLRMKISEMMKEGVLRYYKRPGLPRVICLESYERNKEQYEECVDPSLRQAFEIYSKTDIKRFFYSGKKEKGIAEGNENAGLGRGHTQDSEAYRVYYNSDTAIFMYGIGIELSGAKVAQPCKKAVYVNARELKNEIGYKAALEEIDKEIKINYSRIRGLLMGPSGAYAVYRANSRSAYRQNGEYRMKLYLDRLLVTRYGIVDEVERAILIANEGKQEILENILMPKDNRFQFTSMEFVYKRIYGLPANENGQMLLKVMTMEGWESRIVSSFGLPTCPEMEGTIEDGFNGEVHYYVYCVPEMKRFKRFLMRAKIEEDRKRYVIICFDWQVPLVKEVSQGCATIKKVPFREYIERMKI